MKIKPKNKDAVAFVGNRHILCIHFVHALAHIFIIRLMLLDRKSVV